MSRRRDTIGIDASRATASERTGTENYSYRIVEAIGALNPSEPIELYLNAPTLPPELSAVGTSVPMPFPGLWTHVRLSAHMLARPPGVLFVPSHVVPAIHPRTVVTIHDLGYLHFPDAHTASQRRILDWTTRWSASAARRVIAISATTKQDLVKRYGINEAKITVIPNGVSLFFSPPIEGASAPAFNRFTGEVPFVLAAGTVQPRKNYVNLVRAMSRLWSAGYPHRLLIAGKAGWLADKEIAAIRELGEERVDLLGYVDDEALRDLYRSASVFCMPSLYEGFGMPVLEAMASGTPVVASNTSATAEIAADAAMQVDPRSIESISEGIRSVLDDPILAAELRSRGLRRASQFSWKRSAETTLAVLRETRDER